MLFKDRTTAGQLLAARLQHYNNIPDVLVLALPRGGVPVGFEVAKALDAPLDIFLVRKLGVPGHQELAMGAIASSGVRVLNVDVIQELGLSQSVIDEVTAQEHQELERRELLYRGQRSAINLPGKTIILVDDGLATGATIRAAIAALQRSSPARIVVAVPVAAVETYRRVAYMVDEVVCLETPSQFYSVGSHYQHFVQTTDEEVCNILKSRYSSSLGY